MANPFKSHPTALSYPMIIDGQKIRTAREIAVINPAIGEVFATAARADKAVLDAAVAAVKRASPAWAATPLSERAALMQKLTVWVNEHMALDFDVTARGAKFSGLGGEYGEEGFNAYTQTCVVYPKDWRNSPAPQDSDPNTRRLLCPHT